MDLNLAFTRSASGHFLLVALIFITLKLIATVSQIVLMRGDYRHTPHTALFRIVYITGKVTPALAAVFAWVAAVLQHDRAHSWFFGLFAIFVALLAMYIVRLRRRGQFFGVLDIVSRNQR